MHVGLIELTAEALRKVADAHGDGHLVDPPDSTIENALLAASREINAGLAHLCGALVILQPTLQQTSHPCACEACEIAAMTVDAALEALRESLP